MNKYWIVVENDHQGPFTAEQLAEMKVSEDTYAWHPGLPKWTQIKDIPELAEALAAIPVEAEAPAETVVEEIIETVVDTPVATTEPATFAAAQEEPAPVAEPSIPASNPTVAQEPVREPEPAPAPARPTPPAPPVQVAPPAPQPVYGAYQQPQQPACTPQCPVEAEKCPPSYLAWSIITTILFFLPLGIVAIIFSSKVSGYWATGQIEKARSASEKAAWFSNIAFVVGLIWFPFSMVISGLLS